MDDDSEHKKTKETKKKCNKKRTCLKTIPLTCLTTKSY